MQNNKDNLLSIINIKEDCSKIIDVFKKCNINLKFVGLFQRYELLCVQCSALNIFQLTKI